MLPCPALHGRWGPKLGHLCLHSKRFPSGLSPALEVNLKHFPLLPPHHLPFFPREPPPLHHSPIPCHAHVFNSTKGLSSWQNSSTLGTWVCEAWGLGRSCSHGLEQCTDLTSRYHPWSVGILLKRMYASHLYQAFPPKSLLRAPHLPSCSMTRKSQYLWPQR